MLLETYKEEGLEDRGMKMKIMVFSFDAILRIRVCIRWHWGIFFRESRM